MILVEWNDGLSVGIQEIDEQHKVLVNLVNDMHTAISEHNGREASVKILQKLVDYTRIHFAVEESLMRLFDYPAYETHKAQHEELLKTVVDLQVKVNGGDAISFQLMHFMKMWLTQHILDSDKEYTQHFINHGVRSKSSKTSWFKRLWH